MINHYMSHIDQIALKKELKFLHCFVSMTLKFYIKPKPNSFQEQNKRKKASTLLQV